MTAESAITNALPEIEIDLPLVNLSGACDERA